MNLIRIAEFTLPDKTICMQNTVKRESSVAGIALHTGARAHLKVLPAPVNTGVVFRRVDMPGSPEVKADAYNVVDVRRATTIASKTTGAFVVTVEHIMAALHASRVDNAYVEMDCPEPPIADGSAEPYFDAVQAAGIEPQDVPAEIWTASEPVILEEGETKMVLTPADELRITMIVQYHATPLDLQYFTCSVTPETFKKELAPARTFCIYRELEQLIAAGLIKGGSLDNAIIMHDGAIISKDGMRFPNELVRHKIMDMVGDIFLVGKRVHAHIIAIKPGHTTNVKLAQAMLAQAASGSKIVS